MLQRCGPGERDTTEEKGQASLELVQSPTEGRRSRKKPGKKKKKKEKHKGLQKEKVKERKDRRMKGKSRQKKGE